ncbi:type IV pilus biogenesis protein EbsA [Tumidithrix elongata RA019]|uniref:Type IV pilus biogenesis protein EbsA n=1 Tax=Tumidithrix elongata BACA0141 TaxID=2716417 RepID=A0AAW9Q3B0_9CYAN|nr:type IV pilus biogenesis protein EbsA [Tumidithrix elongata RA019]
MAIELKQAPPQEVSIYMPYYREPNKKQALPYAISLYKQGELPGERQIEGSPPISFLATWRVSNLPADLTLCRVMFEGDAEMSYEITMNNIEFVGYLIDVVASIRDRGTADFPQIFYSKLFRIKLASFDGN